jgi:hypothetical protein
MLVSANSTAGLDVKLVAQVSITFPALVSHNIHFEATLATQVVGGQIAHVAELADALDSGFCFYSFPGRSLRFTALHENH